MLLYGKPSSRQIPVLWLVLSRSGFCSTDRFHAVLQQSQQIQNLQQRQRKKKVWNYQQKLKRLKFFQNFKDGWCFKCKPPEVHFTIRNRVPYVINYLLTELAWAVPGNIGPRSFSYGPRVLSQPRAIIPQYGPCARLVRDYYFSLLHQQPSHR